MNWRLFALKAICGLFVLTSLQVFAETSPEVVEAEKLIKTDSTPISVSGASPAVGGTPAVTASSVATELKEPIAPPTPTSGTEVVNLATKNESEIPVHLEPAKKANSDHSIYFKVILSFLVVVGMGVGGYVLIGRYRRANLTKNPAAQIKILTQHHLGPKKSLAIIRVAGESILIGITDQNISMLKSLALLDEDIPDETPSQFSAIFAAKNTPIEEVAPAYTTSIAATSKTEDEEFSISGIRDFVSNRLKNMRTLE